MIEKLQILGMNEKEAKVYLYLIEYGTSAASEVAKHLAFPKSSVNFLAESLWKRGYLSKSMRSNTHYYEADIHLIEQVLDSEFREKSRFLIDTLPTLREMHKNTHSKPKIVFYDGVENCKKAYREILETSEIVYEFGAHGDLSNAFGSDFMDEFIRERIRRGIFCDSIGTVGPVELELHARDSIELRELAIFGGEYGRIGSSIAIYDTFVLILNLEGVYSGVRIQNEDFAETMKTIFRIAKRG